MFRASLCLHRAAVIGVHRRPYRVLVSRGPEKKLVGRQLTPITHYAIYERKQNMPNLTPSIFFGHGNPMNAVSHNAYTEAWAVIGASMPRPKAILSVSAHWFVPETGVTVTTAPRTIHDFGGFPRELYQVQYPAPGDPRSGASHPVAVGSACRSDLDETWGLDHGTWSVLVPRLPASRYPGSAAQHRRNAARRLPLRDRRAPGALARRRRAHRGQRQPGAQPARVRLGTPHRRALRLGRTASSSRRAK